MRAKIVLLGLAGIAVLCSTGCGDQPKPAASPAQPATAAKSQGVKPVDETHRLPKQNLVESKVVDRELMGKAFMPGGTLAHYKKGKLEYDVFLAHMVDANAAVFALPDWRKALTDARLVPSFGGYFGLDGDRPVFVFSKGSWLAGVAGLPQKDADAIAREVAARLD